MNSKAAFHDEAQWQRACAGCGSLTPLWEAHHVVLRQHCRTNGWPEWDPRNALRVDIIPITGCHYRHHDGTPYTIPTRQLRDENIEFAVECMGVYAVDYLRRYYDDSDPDPRLVALEERAA